MSAREAGAKQPASRPSDVRPAGPVAPGAGTTEARRHSAAVVPKAATAAAKPTAAAAPAKAAAPPARVKTAAAAMPAPPAPGGFPATATATTAEKDVSITGKDETVRRSSAGGPVAHHAAKDSKAQAREEVPRRASAGGPVAQQANARPGTQDAGPAAETRMIVRKSIVVARGAGAAAGRYGRSSAQNPRLTMSVLDLAPAQVVCDGPALLPPSKRHAIGSTSPSKRPRPDPSAAAQQQGTVLSPTNPIMAKSRGPSLGGSRRGTGAGDVPPSAGTQPSAAAVAAAAAAVATAAQLPSSAVAGLSGGGAPPVFLLQGMAGMTLSETATAASTPPKRTTGAASHVGADMVPLLQQPVTVRTPGGGSALKAGPATPGSANKSPTPVGTPHQRRTSAVVLESGQRQAAGSSKKAPAPSPQRGSGSRPRLEQTLGGLASMPEAEAVTAAPSPGPQARSSADAGPAAAGARKSIGEVGAAGPKAGAAPAAGFKKSVGSAKPVGAVAFGSGAEKASAPRGHAAAAAQKAHAALTSPTGRRGSAPKKPDPAAVAQPATAAKPVEHKQEQQLPAEVLQSSNEQPAASVEPSAVADAAVVNAPSGDAARSSKAPKPVAQTVVPGKKGAAAAKGGVTDEETAVEEPEQAAAPEGPEAVEEAESFNEEPQHGSAEEQCVEGASAATADDEENGPQPVEDNRLSAALERALALVDHADLAQDGEEAEAPARVASTPKQRPDLSWLVDASPYTSMAAPPSAFMMSIDGKAAGPGGAFGAPFGGGSGGGFDVGSSIDAGACLSPGPFGGQGGFGRSPLFGGAPSPMDVQPAAAGGTIPYFSPINGGAAGSQQHPTPVLFPPRPPVAPGPGPGVGHGGFGGGAPPSTLSSGSSFGMQLTPGPMFHLGGAQAPQDLGGNGVTFRAPNAAGAAGGGTPVLFKQNKLRFSWDPAGKGGATPPPVGLVPVATPGMALSGVSDMLMLGAATAAAGGSTPISREVAGCSNATFGGSSLDLALVSEDAAEADVAGLPVPQQCASPDKGPFGGGLSVAGGTGGIAVADGGKLVFGGSGGRAAYADSYDMLRISSVSHWEALGARAQPPADQGA
ncbi:hypothetical protein GPECTOR_7g1045 [Gonium pectorale]|uniref:Uncharacterized protein n=1 Tax=Gonium pectorale TaxID=33097 RepID=A0A150GTP7_GONPE|nr:hypothetical protein GPECTOR_7g1045 [Gonium pectorale]|eukprot:KXZ53153.1 hypothetical protein GPECTOR_7g1045 [Gonium pectorale]